MHYIKAKSKKRTHAFYSTERRKENRKLRCRNCGEDIENGLKICSYCGTPVAAKSEAADRPVSGADRPRETVRKPAPRVSQPVQSAARMPRGKKRNLSLTAASAVLLMFSAISLLCAGISVKAEMLGGSIKMSIPIISTSSVISLMTNSSMVKLLIGAYICLTVIIVVFFAAAVFMIITRKEKGAFAGIIGNIAAALIGIIAIIAVFAVNGKDGGEALKTMPSLWLWIEVPINIISCAFLFIEKDDVV